MSDIFNISNSNTKIDYTVGIMSIPNTGVVRIAPIGNININNIQNKYTGADGQHVFRPPS